MNILRALFQSAIKFLMLLLGRLTSFQSEIIETIFLSAGIYDSFILLYPNWFFQFMTGSLSLYIYFRLIVSE